MRDHTKEVSLTATNRPPGNAKRHSGQQGTEREPARGTSTTRRDCDVVVVGSGAAGMSAALSLGSANVVLVTQARLSDGSATAWAKGGIAAAVQESDSPARHAADTLAVGGGLCDPEIVRCLTEAAPKQIGRLVEMGLPLDRTTQKRLALGREAGHSQPRILHAQGDQTGHALSELLCALLRRRDNVYLEEGVAAESLALANGRVAGLLARGYNGDRILYRARAVVLATGGIGGLYQYTTNPLGLRGEGLAIAAQAGARLANLEFVQFHPTALAHGDSQLPLLTEALRGAGATLVDDSGRRFMPRIDRRAELAPRDVVARSIWQILESGGRVFLDARGKLGRQMAGRFPAAHAASVAAGLNPADDLLPVTPAAHYHMGGIAVDAWARSSLPGLWAAGEVACTGLHGANRLASNSLPEAILFGSRAGQSVLTWLGCTPQPPEPELPSLATARDESPAQGAITAELRRWMWRCVGLVRDARGLESAVAHFRRLKQRGGLHPADQHMLEVASMIAQAALDRPESRGAHFRRDFPLPAASPRHLTPAQLAALGHTRGSR